MNPIKPLATAGTCIALFGAGAVFAQSVSPRYAQAQAAAKSLYLNGQSVGAIKEVHVDCSASATSTSCTVSVDALLNMCKITFHSLADSQAALARINDSVAPSSPAVKCSGTIETGMKTLIGTPQSISLEAANLGRGVVQLLSESKAPQRPPPRLSRHRVSALLSGVQGQ